jgi:murein L,D-transpeptidase YcbB/YkuD
MKLNCRTLFAAFLSLFLLAAVPAGAQVSGGELKAALNSTQRLPLPIERIRAALKQHYVANGAAPYWNDSARRASFLQRLRNAQLDGLNPADYPAETLAELGGDALGELYYSAFYVAYAADLRIGRVAPQKVDPHLFRSRKTIDISRALGAMAKQPDPGKSLSSFEPRNQHYQALKRMMKIYTTVAREHEWPVISQGGAVKPGGSDPRVPAIRSLLSFTGDYEGEGGGSSVYDKGLATAVQRFQQRHGLEAKGLLGKQTIMAMNVPPQERIRQIMVNMERWRWMPDALGDEHFLVNIAAFELQRVQQNEIVDRMNVVTGAVATQTPEFSDEMEYVELNPYWTVPYSIATKEMLPKLKQNPYAYAEDFEVFVNGKVADWSSVNWASYGSGSFPFTFRQLPGDRNALGKVKFMLPNRHNIYFHDTPSKDKFASTSRAFSHGCIRLSRPIDLLHDLASEVPGWSPALADQVLVSGKNTRMTLPRKIPVHLIYATAFKGAGGIEFRPDVYGRDRKLAAALLGRPST